MEFGTINLGIFSLGVSLTLSLLLLSSSRKNYQYLTYNSRPFDCPHDLKWLQENRRPPRVAFAGSVQPCLIPNVYSPQESPAEGAYNIFARMLTRKEAVNP